jgi:hypothetical protein
MHVIYEGEGLSRDPSISLLERLILGWGKVRRFYLLYFRSSYVEQSLKRRVGECHRTGSCCQLAFSCPWLGWVERLPACRSYKLRPRNCTVFPIDERDLRDRDIVNPWEPCGFSFLSPEEAREKAEAEEKRQPELVIHA